MANGVQDGVDEWEVSVATSERIRPLARERWSPEHRYMMDATVDRTRSLESGAVDQVPTQGADPVGILAVLANHPTLLGPFLTWASAVAYGQLSRRHHELLALRTAWLLASEFEYGHHVAYARGAGLTEAEIAAVRAGPDNGPWSDLEAALLRAADEVADDVAVTDATWAVLADNLSVGQLIEVPVVIGQYTMLSTIVNVLGIPLEPGYEHLPTRA
jgi:alkylhydroperoxidase family enzyme